MATQASQLALGRLEQNDLAALLARQAYLFNRDSKGYALDQVDRALRLALGLPHFADALHRDRGAGAVAFSSDGRWLASGGSGGIDIWDLGQLNAVCAMLRGPRKLTPRATLRGDGNGAVAWLSFRPQRQELVSVNSDGSVCFWDLRQPDAPLAILDERAHMIEGNTAYGEKLGYPPCAAAFSPDGRIFAVDCGQGGVRLWDISQIDAVPTGPIATPPALDRVPLADHTLECLRALAFGGDGRTLVLIGGGGLEPRSRGTVEIWGLPAPGRLLSKLNPPDWVAMSDDLGAYHGHYPAIAMSSDGQMLAECPAYRTRSTHVILWSLHDLVVDVDHGPGAVPKKLSPGGNVVSSKPSEHARGVTFSPDSRQLAVSCEYKTQLWDLSRPHTEPTIMGGWGVGELAFSPDGKILAAVEEPYWRTREQKTQGCVRMWYLRPAEAEATSTVLSGHQNEVRSVTFSADGQTLASCSLDQTIRLWDLSQPGTDPTVLDCRKLGIDLGFCDFPRAESGSPSKYNYGQRQRSPSRRPLPIALSREGQRLAVVATKTDREDKFDLRLMPSVSNVGDIPTAGKSLVIVATIPVHQYTQHTNPNGEVVTVDYGMSGLFHFRIFDADGKVVVDKNETDRVWTPSFVSLKSDLDHNGLWPPHELTRFEKDWIIAKVTSLVGYTREDEREGIFVFDRHRPGDTPTVLQGPLITNYALSQVCSPDLLGMAFEPDGQALIAIDFCYGLGWGFVRKWDLSQPDAGATVLHELRGLEPVTALSSDGKMLASAGVASLGSPWNDDEMYAAVKVWDLGQIGIEPIILSVDDVPLPTRSSIEDGSAFRARDPHVSLLSLAFSSNGRMLAAGNENGGITLWHLDRPESALGRLAGPPRPRLVLGIQPG